MNIDVNGSVRDVADDAVVADLVTESRGVAVAVNGSVVPKTEWASVRVSAGDRIEIVTAHQGG